MSSEPLYGFGEFFSFDSRSTGPDGHESLSNCFFEAGRDCLEYNIAFLTWV